MKNHFLQPDQNYNKICGTEPWYLTNLDLKLLNEMITNTIQKRKSKGKIYLDITKKCQHMTEIKR